ncbi:serine hydrolase domain-containing protein [Flavobacterium sp.]|jgi:CubicO group peptidase (beta-lactamase class C family)|uniref:serine hydrolase domain-containing protein n=1 Tax=Flavobacterium sp. TaxID=239 RepID=UPI0037C069B0
MRKIFILLLVPVLFLNCSSDSDSTVDTPAESMYFPPLTGTTWETKSIGEMGWNENEVQPLLTFLEEKNTKGFIILVNGRIVMENYFNGHTASLPWYWASAGKTLTTATIGIAQQEGLLSINDKVSDYLGTGWTSAPLAKENLITNKHLLSMTSGLDDAVGNGNDPIDLIYKADAGTRWAYHNVFEKLQDVIAEASNQTFDAYFTSKLKSKIGMTGGWFESDEFNVYWSTTRSTARFGLLSLNKGKWNTEVIVPEDYMMEATSTSQSLNNAYGYLWWLNGKANYRLPQTQLLFSGSLIPSAPNDMYCALGKNDQKIYVIPSKKMVVVRLGEVADGENFALSDFDDQLWQKINAVIN